MRRTEELPFWHFPYRWIFSWGRGSRDRKKSCEEVDFGRSWSEGLGGLSLRQHPGKLPIDSLSAQLPGQEAGAAKRVLGLKKDFWALGSMEKRQGNLWVNRKG